MSAFFVSAECMQRVIAGVAQIDKEWMGDYTVKGFGPVANNLDKLGKSFYKMNNRALYERYAEKPSSTTFCYKPKFSSTIKDKCRWLKAMHCLRYQCSEGRVPDSHLYQGLDKAIGDLASSIVDELPEYKAAKWD